MYITKCIILSRNKHKELVEYFSEQCKLAKLLRNATYYRCRQLYFAYLHDYQSLREEQVEVLKEFETTYPRFKEIGKKHTFPSYFQMDNMYRQTKNPDYFNALPMQSSQQIVKKALTDFRSFFVSSQEYKKHPDKFTGKPKIPNYAKKNEITYTITNQDALIKGNQLKLPITKERLFLGNLEIQEGMKLKQVEVSPFYDTYKITLVFQNKKETKKATSKPSRMLGIDLGLNNIISTSNNCGLTPFVVKGNKIKSVNQWYNKKMAFLKSELMKAKEPQYTSKQTQCLDKYRHNYTTDLYNKCAFFVVKYCVEHNIDTIIIGKNTHWKKEINIGGTNNQNFCFIAHSILINKIQSIASNNGIATIINEESYTSKSSFLDFDDIPTYGKDGANEKTFSGQRVHRGLYKSKNGILINADVNGASNIIRKACPHAFDTITDFSYLYQTTDVIRL